MDNSSINPGSLRGFLCTILLYIFARITVSNVASIAMILSGCTVFLVNLPKMIAVYQTFIRPKIKRKK
jgi:hypothetical protein